MSFLLCALCAPWAPERWWLYLSARRFGHLPRTPSAPGPPLAEPRSPERGPWGVSQWLVRQKLLTLWFYFVLKKSHQWWCVVRTAVRDKPSLFTISRSCEKKKKRCSQWCENISEIKNIVIWKLTISEIHIFQKEWGNLTRCGTAGSTATACLLGSSITRYM